MKKGFIYFALISCTLAPISAFAQADNVLTGQEKNEGWELLWDGKTTNGWRGAKLQNFPEKGWNIIGNELVVEKPKEKSRVTEEISSPSKHIKTLNWWPTSGSRKEPTAGIKYFVDPELNKGEGSAIGCEFQILDDDQTSGCQAGKKRQPHGRLAIRPDPGLPGEAVQKK